MNNDSRVILDDEPNYADPGRERARKPFRVRGYNRMSDRNRALVDMLQAGAVKETGHPVDVTQILGVIADIAADMTGWTPKEQYKVIYRSGDLKASSGPYRTREEARERVTDLEREGFPGAEIRPFFQAELPGGG